MAIEYFEGFETASAPAWINSGFTFTAGNARTGGYGIGNTQNPTSTLLLSLPATAKKTVGVAVRPAANMPGRTDIAFMQILGDSGVTVHLSLTLDASAHVQLRLGTSAGTVLATSTLTLTTGAWTYLELQATVADSGGRATVRANGVTFIDFTGDTKNAGTSTNIDAIRILGASNAFTACSWDDVYVCNGTDATATTGRPDNDFLGDCAVQALLPNGEGATLEWTPSTGTSHSGTVDESPPNTTDYVSAATDGLRDLWTLGDLNATTAQVLGVRAVYYAAKSDTGACTIKPAIRESSGTVTVDSSIPLGTSFGIVSGDLRTARPGGGAWTPGDVNSLQLGVEKASS